MIKKYRKLLFFTIISILLLSTSKVYAVGLHHYSTSWTPYDSYGTYQYWTDGAPTYNAVCIDPQNSSIPSGTNLSSVEVGPGYYSNLYAALYYMYDLYDGAPGWASIAPRYDENFCGGQPCSPSEYYAWSHVVLAYVYATGDQGTAPENIVWWTGLTQAHKTAVQAVASYIDGSQVSSGFHGYLIKASDNGYSGYQSYGYWEYTPEPPPPPPEYCFTVNKKNALTDANLSGAKFALYGDSACATPLSTENYTDGNGNITWTGLSSSTYWVQEIGAPAGYENNNYSCHAVTASESNCPVYTFKDYPYLYCVKVRKVDSENNNLLLNGAKFDAYNSSNVKLFSGTTGSTVSHNNIGSTVVSSGTSAETGYYIVDLLPNENFTFVETNSEGDLLTNGSTTRRYWKSTDRTSAATPVQMTRNGNTYTCPTGTGGSVTAKDYKQYTCLKVKKVDTRGNLLTGASFSTTINGSTVTHADNWDGVNDGYTTFFTGDSSSSSLRSYTITETAAPDEFRRRTATATVTEVLLPKNQTAAEAEANCKNANGTTNSGEKIINSSGTVTFTNDKYVINWYKEREGGTNTNGAEFKVYTTINGTKQYVVAKQNSASETWKDENGVTKTCYVFNSLTTNANSGTTFTSMNTQTNGGTSNGEVCIVGFDTDDSNGTGNDRTYTVEETKPLNFHTFGDAKTKNIRISKNYYSEASGTLFKNYKTEFKFTKTVSNPTGNDYSSLTTSELRKIPFSIYPANSNTAISFRKTSDGVYEYASNTIDAPSGSNVTTLFLNSSRELYVYHLPVGSYVIKELRKCCDSTCSSCSSSDDQCIGYYHPNDSGKAFSITTCSSPSATSCGSGQYGVVTQTLNNVPTLITFTKKDLYNYASASSTVKFEDEAERSAFDQIKFQLKDKNGNAVSLVKVANHGNCKTDDSYAEYRYIQSGETLPSGTTRTTDLYTCGGHIQITHLCRGKDYKLVEAEVPANTVFVGKDSNGNVPTVNYNIPFASDGSSCCNNTSRATNTIATISDEPTTISIYKRNYNPNESIKEGSSKKETAQFQLYRCNSNVATCTYATSTQNPVKFKELANQASTGIKTYKFVLNQSETSGYITTLALDNSNGDDARIVMTYLPANYKYVLVESNAPDGYYNVDSNLNELNVEISKENTTTTLNRINYPTRIKFTKDDFYTYFNSNDLDAAGSSTKIFDSMTFKLHDQDGNIVNLYKVADGEYRFINKKGEHNGTVTELHTKNGEMLITHIYRNENYYLEETAVDTEGNFILPNNIDNSGLGLPASMANNKHPIVKYSMGNLVPDFTDPNKVPTALTQMIDNKATRVVFEKRDSETGELIDDNNNTRYDEDENYQNVLTTFNVYRCNKSVSHCTIDNGTLVYFKDRDYIKDKNNHDITEDITSITPPVLAYEYSKENKTEGAVKDLHTDRGLLVMAHLPSEYKYVLYETVAPNGYYNPTREEAQTEFTVKDSSLDNGDTYEKLTSVVSNEPTEIYFVKSDMYDYYDKDDLSKVESDIKIFDSMKFVIRNSQGKIMKLKCSSNGEATGEDNEDRCRTGEYRYLPVDDDNTITNMHTLNGNIKITHLYRDEVYYIEEVSEDTEGNFILPDYLNFSEALPFDNQGHPVVKYTVPLNSPSSRESVTSEIENVPSRVAFQKRDSKYNYLIPDETTTFNLYQCSIDVEKCTPEVGTLMNFTERAVISGDQEDSNKEVYKYKKLNASGVTDLHPYRGELIFRYLPTKYKYVLVETVSPLGYMLPEGENAYTYFTISETKVDVEEIQVPNKPVSLLIRKYAQDGELLEGAEFSISKAKNCNFNVAPNLVETTGILKLKTIRDGVYEVRPAGDTELFRTCQDRPDMPCNMINTTLTDPQYLTEVFGNSMGDFEALVNSRNERINVEAGEALVQYLDYGGCYVIKEEKAPKGYSLPEREEDRYVMIKITDKEQVFDTYEELVNKPTPYTFYKTDEFNNPLDGAKYKLQVLNDSKIYKDVPVTLEESENGEYYYKVDPDSDNYIMETKGGKATISYLEEGQYRVLEVEAPEGYELPIKTMNVATFFVDEQGRVYGSHIIANKPKTEKKEIKPSAKAILVVNIQTGQKIIKYGAIISVIIAAICILIFFKRKKIDKKDE